MTGRPVFLCIVYSVLFLSLFSCSSAPPPDFDEDEWLEKARSADLASLYANHRNPDGTFFNPWLQRTPRASNWRSKEKRQYDDFSPEKYSHVKNDYSYLKDKNFDSISYAGHSSMIIKMNGETVFTDPFFSNHALILAKKLKLKFDYSQVPDKPVVLISHNHYDHLDKTTVKKLIKKNALFLVPLNLKKYITGLGAKEVYELDWWESIQLGPLNYTFLPAQHWSRRIGDPGGTVLWGGWLIRGSHNVYFSGDSGYFRGFEEFGNRFDIDYALISAGAYEPRWFMHYAHMNVEECIRAAHDMNAKIAIPFHFGVITLSEEPLLYPLYEIDKYVSEHPEDSERFRPLRVGEYLVMEKKGP